MGTISQPKEGFIDYLKSIGAAVSLTENKENKND